MSRQVADLGRAYDGRPCRDVPHPFVQNLSKGPLCASGPTAHYALCSSKPYLSSYGTKITTLKFCLFNHNPWYNAIIGGYRPVCIGLDLLIQQKCSRQH